MPSAQTQMVGLFGDPPRRIVEPPANARQFSPLVPKSAALEGVDRGSLASMTMLAPPGTLDRRFQIAAMLRALAVDAPFTVLAAKDLGGARVARELAAMGCPVEERVKAHHRICSGRRPDRLDEDGLLQAYEDGAPRFLTSLGLWSQPGIFSWDRVDPGTALLAAALPQFAGRGADLGCGVGILAHAILAGKDVSRLDLLDIDRRAVEAARRNVDDRRAVFVWADVTSGLQLDGLDFVVTNPPFHIGGNEDKNIGLTFIRRAAEMLRSGGRLWLVANRHLPYEAVLGTLFRRVTPHAEAHGYKIVAAVK